METLIHKPTHLHPRLTGFVLLASLSLVMPDVALANGFSSNQNVGRALVTLVKTSVSRISQVRDLSIDKTTISVGDARVVTSDICVHSVSGSYNLTPSGSRPQFTLIDPTTGQSLPYNLKWITRGRTTRLLPDTMVKGLLSGSEQNCGGDGWATLEFSIDTTGYQNIPTGNYIDTVTLLMQPE